MNTASDSVLASTAYAAVTSVIKYLGDLPPYPTISTIKLAFPMTRSEILTQFREHLRSLPRHGSSQKIVTVFDGIISNPGILLPWEEMVTICKEEGVWSVVDAAHCIGQQLHINLAESQPDFWVSVSLHSVSCPSDNSDGKSIELPQMALR